MLEWLASRNDRYEFVDYAVGDQGHGDSVIDDIGRGQLWEKLEVAHALVDSLQARIDAEETE